MRRKVLGVGAKYRFVLGREDGQRDKGEREKGKKKSRLV